MSDNNKKSSDEQEVDLAMISKKVGGFVDGIKDLVFDAIQFVLKNAIVLAVLFAIGLGIGIYKDSTDKVYDHQLVVTPNFGTADYLYAKVDLIQSKIKERDTFFLEKIGIKNPAKLAKIEIKPIVDIYQFINNNSERNFDLLKLMAEDNDLKKILEERPTSKNYSYHLISFTTKERTNSQKTVEPLLNYLNNSTYYSKVQREAVQNTKIRVKENELIIAQINSFLNGVGSGQGKGEKLVYYNENSPLNDIIETKMNLVREQGNLRLSMINYDKIIKQISSVLNIENTTNTNGKLKFLLPLLLILGFVLVKLFVQFYKNQSKKRQQAA